MLGSERVDPLIPLNAAGLRRFLLLVLLLAGWGGGLAQPLSAIRIAHASPDAPQVDVVVSRQLFLTDVEYGQVTQYRSLPAGQHEISIYPHRLSNAELEEAEGVPALEPITVLVDLGEGEYYTLAVSGFFEPAPAGGVTGSLSVEVNPDTTTIGITGPLGYAQQFQGDTALSDLPPGDYSIVAQASGYSPANFSITVREEETATVSISLQEGESGAQTPEVVEGRSSGVGWRPLELHVFTDALNQVPPPGGARARVIHLAPTLQGVDLLAQPVDGSEAVLLAQNLNFPNAGQYVRFPHREYELQLRVAGAGATLQELGELQIQPGGSYTFLLVQEPEDNIVSLIPVVDQILPVRP